MSVRRTPQAKQPASRPEAELAWHIRALQLPAPRTEYRFHDTRRWRFDFAWPERLLAVEIEGGGYVGLGNTSAGHHHSAQGFERDCAKYNAAVLGGWRLLRFTPGQVMRGEAIAVLEQAFA